jgi:Mg2+-importing ATPase
VLFRSGWFAESLATQTLVIFVIRTRRIRFLRSRPSLPLTLAALGTATAGVIIPALPFAGALGFAPLPWTFVGALVLMTATYLVLVEAGKWWFYRRAAAPAAAARRGHHHRIGRRAARFSTGGRLAGR